MGLECCRETKKGFTLRVPLCCDISCLKFLKENNKHNAVNKIASIYLLCTSLQV